MRPQSRSSVNVLPRTRTTLFNIKELRGNALTTCRDQLARKEHSRSFWLHCQLPKPIVSTRLVNENVARSLPLNQRSGLEVSEADRLLRPAI